MNLMIISKPAMCEWINKLAHHYRVSAPQSADDQIVFGKIANVGQVVLDYQISVLPPKKALLPQHEDLLQFNRQADYAEAIFDTQPTILLGVHTCDLHAINLLDQVFLSAYPDQHYQTRRENTTLISIECQEPCTEYSFCRDMGALITPEKFDLHLIDLGEDYALRIGSQRGAQLLDGFETLNPATEKDRIRYQKAIQTKWSRFPYRLEPDISELPHLVNASYKLSLWQELERRCLGCGKCTLVCPTCYCFDVIDDIDLNLSVGKRYRKWDSCQLNQFASVAGGHNFRPLQSNRQRHRFLRKYKYQAVAPGLLGCVGCGRCASTCLVNINPVDVLNRLYQSINPSAAKEKEATFT